VIDDPKSSTKGGTMDGGPMTRVGLVATLEALIAQLEAQIRPIQEQIRALRIIVEQENDSLSLDRRRQLRALERSKAATPN
jgi:TolA-binding protein